MKITIEFDHNEMYALDVHNSPVGTSVYVESGTGHTSNGVIIDYSPSNDDK